MTEEEIQNILHCRDYNIDIIILEKYSRSYQF